MRVRAYICCLSVLLFAGTAAADPLTDADQHWQALARADLEAVHDTIKRTHPGAIDPLNPEFHVWMEDGYRRALALLPRVYDYNSMLDAVRYYVVGFQDGHLLYSDDVRTQATHDAPFPIIYGNSMSSMVTTSSPKSGQISHPNCRLLGRGCSSATGKIRKRYTASASPRILIRDRWRLTKPWSPTYSLPGRQGCEATSSSDASSALQRGSSRSELPTSPSP